MKSSPCRPLDFTTRTSQGEPFMSRYRIPHALLGVLLLACSVHAQLSVSTGLVSDTGQDGNMFDIRAIERLQIVGFDLNLDAGAWDIEVYTTTSGGSFLGFETDPTGWTMIESVNVMSAGANTASPLPLDLDVEIAAGGQRGFYVTVVNGPAMNYRNGDGIGSIEGGNAYIEVLEGVGKSHPFASTFGNAAGGREWSGNVHYRVIKEANYCEDFDGAVAGTDLPLPWEQIQGENDPSNGSAVDWIVRGGQTPSLGTGPLGDQGSGIGNYVYVEDSGNDHVRVSMRTPLIDLDAFAQPVLSFWYHSLVGLNPVQLYDNTLSLHVYNRFGIQVDTLISLADSGSDWQQLYFDLSEHQVHGLVMLEFAVNNLDGGGHFYNDIAIDDVCVEEGGFDFFGSGDPLVFGSQVDANGGALAPMKEALPGQQININLANPSGSLPGAIPVIVGQFFFDMTPPGSVLADVYVDALSQFPAFVIYDGSIPTPLGPSVLDDSHVSLNFIIPAVGGLFSLRLQGLALSPLSNNGIYSASMGHTIDLL